MTPLEETEVLAMDWTMTLTFGGLSVIVGALVGLGTLSPIRGVFTFLVFLGLAMTMFLFEVGVNEVLSFFLGQLIVVGSTYLGLSILHPSSLEKQEKNSPEIKRLAVTRIDHTRWPCSYRGDYARLGAGESSFDT